ncbi:peptide/nickel transport system substrate-binding protein [Caldanaerobius fijiensis DSM 17918]|uniref:Peptide/nickel transport system substrate-binding protein n=1 Tax=Caldanaerobius fijiensis DSM 17918 TaxID=1121256 RepID=A0A1M4TQ59_9THEO|nr:ABC transporter substrate-binding protein [Caldanaerobius fijiensis]SHE46583.1 peptide/nickel transport system substrate-binding protein [Caldanaerobius fijiensis DSM 17918]
MSIKKGGAVLITFLIIVSLIFSGCSKASNTASNNKTASTQYSDTPKYNKDRSFRDISSWPKPPLYQGNPFAAGGVGWQAYSTCFEGLFENIAVSGTIYNRLAKSVENKGNETIIKLQPNVKWNDGKPFTSKDVWAYYMINNGAAVMKFLTDIETPDDNTIVFKWAEPAPNDRLKIALLAQDMQGTVQYEYYKKYVDRAAELLKNGKPTNDPAKKGAFGKEYDQKTNDELNKNWQEFTKAGPKLPLGTGPFMVKSVTASDMILVKNPYYWRAKNVKFDKIILKQVDQAGAWAMLKAGQLDRFDGTPNKDILENMLNTNKDLAHYMTLDNASAGFVFNIQKPPFNDVKFRRALMYVFDKQKIKDVGNYYGTTTEYSTIGMPFSYSKEWVTQDIMDKMTKFTYDPAKAEELLKQDGWTKGSDGIWRDKNGKQYNFVIATDSTAFQFVNPSEVAAEQLTKFGFPTKLMAVDPSMFYTNAQYPNNKYDMSSSWIENSWGLYSPYGALSGFYWGFASSAGNFPRYKTGPKAGQLNMVLPGPDGQPVDIDKTLKEMLFMSDEDQKKVGSVLAWIANENAFGLPYYQNVSGFWLNIKRIKGYPLPDLVKKYNRNVPLQTDPENVKILDDHWYLWVGQGKQFSDGTYAPN